MPLNCNDVGGRGVHIDLDQLRDLVAHRSIPNQQ
jgi:hypothetical protein